MPTTLSTPACTARLWRPPASSRPFGVWQAAPVFTRAPPVFTRAPASLSLSLSYGKPHQCSLEPPPLCRPRALLTCTVGVWCGCVAQTRAGQRVRHRAHVELTLCTCSLHLTPCTRHHGTLSGFRAPVPHIPGAGNEEVRRGERERGRERGRERAGAKERARASEHERASKERGSKTPMHTSATYYYPARCRTLPRVTPHDCIVKEKGRGWRQEHKRRELLHGIAWQEVQEMGGGASASTASRAAAGGARSLSPPSSS